VTSACPHVARGRRRAQGRVPEGRARPRSAGAPRRRTPSAARTPVVPVV